MFESLHVHCEKTYDKVRTYAFVKLPYGITSSLLTLPGRWTLGSQVHIF